MYALSYRLSKNTFEAGYRTKVRSQARLQVIDATLAVRVQSFASMAYNAISSLTMSVR